LRRGDSPVSNQPKMKPSTNAINSGIQYVDIHCMFSQSIVPPRSNSVKWYGIDDAQSLSSM
jgi:hypothetical protein